MAKQRERNRLEKAKTRTQRDLVYSDAIDDVVEYCKEQEWEVRRGAHVEDEAYSDEGYINLSTTQTNEIAFYTLLHEVGHMLHGQDEDYWDRYPGLALAKSNIKYKVSFIEEEIDAWRRGMEVAYDLKLHSLIDQKKWDLTRCRCLFSHIKCQVNARGFNKDE